MKKYLVTGLAVALVLLGGCADKAKKKSISASSTTTSSTNLMHTDGSGKKVKTATTESTKKVTEPAKAAAPVVKTDTALWNSDKKVKLQQFMATWGTSMNQSYKEYSPESSVKFYNSTVPVELVNGDLPTYIDQKQVKVSWSSSGAENQGYNIVTTYSDAEAAGDSEQHFYLFTLVDGQPKVLVCLLKGYFEYHALEFAETQNTDLQNGFAEIIGSDSAATTAPVKSTYEPMHVDGYPDDQVLAAQAWLTKFGASTDQSGIFEFSYFADPAGSAVAPVPESVVFPVATYVLGGSPASYPSITFANNNDGTITRYPVDKSFRSEKFLDPEYSKTYTQKILDDAETITLQTFSQDELKAVLQKLYAE